MRAQLSDLEALSRALRSVRARHYRLTQEALSVRAGLGKNTAGTIERAETDPSYTTLLKLARAVDVPLAEIIAIAESIKARP